MYVIGTNEFSFIRITDKATLYDGRKIWGEIKALEYEASLHQATILPNYEDAEKLLSEIQNSVDKIKFANNNIIGEILDKQNDFDKIAYSKELGIYELMPVKVNYKEA